MCTSPQEDIYIIKTQIRVYEQKVCINVLFIPQKNGFYILAHACNSIFVILGGYALSNKIQAKEEKEI